MVEISFQTLPDFDADGYLQVPLGTSNEPKTSRHCMHPTYSSWLLVKLEGRSLQSSNKNVQGLGLGETALTYSVASGKHVGEMLGGSHFSAAGLKFRACTALVWNRLGKWIGMAAPI